LEEGIQRGHREISKEERAKFFSVKKKFEENKNPKLVRGREISSSSLYNNIIGTRVSIVTRERGRDTHKRRITMMPRIHPSSFSRPQNREAHEFCTVINSVRVEKEEEVNACF